MLITRHTCVHPVYEAEYLPTLCVFALQTPSSTAPLALFPPPNFRASRVHRREPVPVLLTVPSAVTTPPNDSASLPLCQEKTRQQWKGMAVSRTAKNLLRNGSRQLASRRVGRPVRIKSEEPPYAVKVPETKEYLDTPNIKVAAGLVVGVVLAKLTMMYDESLEPERLERQAKEFAEVQASLKPLTKEQWDEIQELRPRTPFESSIARSNARIRTGELLSLEDVKDWAIDVLTESMTRKEESLQC